MGKTIKRISPRMESWVLQYVDELLERGEIKKAHDEILHTVVKPHLFGSFMNDRKSCIWGNGPVAKRWAKKMLRRAIRIEGKNECREAIADPRTTIPIEWDYLAELHLCQAEDHDTYVYLDSQDEDWPGDWDEEEEIWCSEDGRLGYELDEDEFDEDEFGKDDIWNGDDWPALAEEVTKERVTCNSWPGAWSLIDNERA